MGKCLSWKEAGFGDLVDGRTDEGKAFIVIIDADMLTLKGDDFYWENVDTSTDSFKKIHGVIHNELEKFFSNSINENRKKKIASVKRATSNEVISLPNLSRKKIDTFITEVVNSCPSIKINDLNNLVKILSTLETSLGKFAILDKMSKLSKKEWEDLNTILTDWTIDMAKAVLDEIQGRLHLIEELRRKANDESTLEVQELQPLMEKCLWMLGPEFDSIEYTSNATIAKNYQKFMQKKCDVKTSQNRPDFTILPDATLSFYTADGFDNSHELSYISKLLIIELKAPSVSIGREEKQQPFKYYDEFKSIGLIQEKTKVEAYVIGSRLQKTMNSEPNTEGNVSVRILTFNILLSRAEKRMFNLRKKLLEAPFMKKELELK